MPDAPGTPRKPVSSTSQAAKGQKKAGAPKPKGAVRAKSGCYTCRIRRKKCDEQPNEAGACQTCVRLRLQCLGFGAKRPEWMRENNSVTELREKIKAFLASQGMIKGHSGSGPRTADQDPPVLILVEAAHLVPSSPPTPNSATSSDSHRPHNGLNTSFVREGAAPSHYAPIPPEQQPYNVNVPTWQPPMPGMEHPNDPAAMNRGNMLPNVNDMLYQPPPQPPSNVVQSPSSIVPIASSSSSWPAPGGGASTYASTSTYYHSAVVPYQHPISTLAPSYNVEYVYSDEELDSPDGPLIPVSVPGYAMPLIPSEQSQLVQHYLSEVLPRQYLLADMSIMRFMFELLQKSPSARDAACVLSAMHLSCVHRGTHADSVDVRGLFSQVQNALLSSRRSGYTEGDAMAGLHIVSSFLFSGGRGSWEIWLNIASQYVSAVLNDPQFYGPDDALMKCSESTRFIIKTTMWFDVLASVTTQRVPTFYEVYRQLFGYPTGAYIGNPISDAPEISMLPVMGCENKIVLAIAEISNLACWAEGQRRRGSLSILQLVQRGLDIEQAYLISSSPYQGGSGVVMYGPHPQHHHGMAQSDASDIEVAQRRRLTNDIFRASARIYLHTVLSGDNPSCPEIMSAVTETIECLRRVPTHMPMLHRSVVRSVVFGICLAGCMTDDPRQRMFVHDMLDSQQVEGVGNVTEVMNLMKQVWQRRDSGEGRIVNWRHVMRDAGRELLLLV